MPGNSARQMQALFEAQFEPETDGFVYRKHSRGVPYHVTAEERSAFVQTFVRRIRFCLWGMMGAMVALILLVALLVGDPDAPGADLALYGGLFGCIGLFVAGYYWAWNEPTRALQRRPAIGNALTATEARSLAFSQISYGNLALGPLIGIFLICLHLEAIGAGGWGTLWLAMGTGLIVLSIVQAIRKWMHERG